MLKHKHNKAQHIVNNTMLLGNGSSCQELFFRLLLFLASSLWAATCTKIAKHCSYRQLSRHALVISIFPSRSVLRRTVHCQGAAQGAPPKELFKKVSPKEFLGPHVPADRLVSVRRSLGPKKWGSTVKYGSFSLIVALGERLAESINRSKVTGHGLKWFKGICN
jgi:hypothetical protein